MLINFEHFGLSQSGILIYNIKSWGRASLVVLVTLAINLSSLVLNAV